MTSSRGWLQGHDERLRVSLDAGLSHSEAAIEINAEFGTRYSRNACISRANRIGIKSKLGPADGPRRQIPRTPRQYKPRPDLVGKAPGLDVSTVSAEPLHIGLSDLSDLSCRYPFGDGPFTFCGHLSRAGSSYCNHHYSLTLGEGRKPRSGDRELRIRSFVRSERRAVVEAAE